MQAKSTKNFFFLNVENVVLKFKIYLDLDAELNETNVGSICLTIYVIWNSLIVRNEIRKFFISFVKSTTSWTILLPVSAEKSTLIGRYILLNKNVDLTRNFLFSFVHVQTIVEVVLKW